MPLLLHRIGHSLPVLKEAGCKLTEPENLFNALMIESKGDPCQTGCSHFNGGKCPAFQEYHSVAIDRRENAKHEQRMKETSNGLIGGKWKGMTSAQIRAQEGITREEFQRRKQAGNYAE